MADSMSRALYADAAPERTDGLWAFLSPEDRAAIKRQVAEEAAWEALLAETEAAHG